ncbi:MAG: peptide/nickel transport system permease protein [Kribbellaceae bacterium]|jgi:peptide/nickel transport system permease protein|nr:peptide/nickel transport system permease protein [Kribbellaceae bacterium]
MSTVALLRRPGVRLAGRTLLIAPVLLVVTMFAFALSLLVPGDPAHAILGEAATPESVAALRAELGLTQPVLERYVHWLGDVLSGDLGRSLFGGTPVLDSITARLPVTISLVGAAILLTVVVAVPLGLLAGYKKSRTADRIAGVLVSVGQALPPFWVGLVLVAVVALGAGLLPPYGYVPASQGVGQYLQHLILPALALAIPGTCELFLQTRTAAAEVFSEDYVRTARAAGLSTWSILTKWGAKNAMVPVVTVSGLQLDRLIGVAALVEAVFGMQGIGSLAVTAALNSDIPTIQGVVLVVGGFVLVVNLCVDLSYTYFNPRLRS